MESGMSQTRGSARMISGAVAAAGLLLGGCTLSRRDPTPVRQVPTQVEPSSQVDLPPPSARWDGNVLNVSGVVRRTPGNNGEISGHVHVDLLAADGELLDQVLLRWMPQSVPIEGARQSPYRVNYRIKLSAGATVRIAVVDDEEEHAFPAPGASGGGGTAVTSAGIPRGIGTPGTLGKPKTGKARATRGTPKQKTSTPRTPSGRYGRGGGR